MVFLMRVPYTSTLLQFRADIGHVCILFESSWTVSEVTCHKTHQTVCGSTDVSEVDIPGELLSEGDAKVGEKSGKGKYLLFL